MRCLRCNAELLNRWGEEPHCLSCGYVPYANFPLQSLGPNKKDILIEEAELKPKRRPMTEDERLAIIDERGAGTDYDTIALIFERHRMTIYRILLADRKSKRSA